MLSQSALPVTLDQFLASLDGLPSEVKQNLNAMQTLDERTQRLAKEADEMTAEYIRNAKQMTKASRREASAAIRRLYEQCCSIADEKVNLANQAYELVDGHIRRLDETLARFEADFRSNVAQYQSAPVSKPAPLLSEASSNTAAVPSSKKRKQEAGTPLQSKKKSKVELETPGTTKQKKLSVAQETGTLPVDTPSINVASGSQWASLMQQATAGFDSTGLATGAQGSFQQSGDVVMDSVLDMPVDPNEPTYCICHHVSYGEMIGCDNPDCPIEWFHFGCMGLTEQPSGEWFCPHCAPLMAQSGAQRNVSAGKKQRKAPSALKK